MKGASLGQVRQRFLDFFAQQDHEIVPSAPLVPHNDPSLLFVNAGMVPFKRVFMGQDKRDYNKAASAQKCVRAGGKHNDLEMVGHTKRHHTFFEMLGNFSFGAYFKEEAIAYAWTFLTDVLALDKNRLYITVHSSDSASGVLWKKLTGFTDDRILSLDTDDNFWSMGETGPCGPCTEIFYDHGAHLPGGLPGTPEQDGDRFVEIWNLVFMQFMQESTTVRKPLPKPGVDTGIGLERLTAVLQGVDDNYDIDVFKALRRRAMEVLDGDQTSADSTGLKVIADHVRAAAFLLGDGVLPAADGRGYVLRRLVRRAQRYALHYGHQGAFLGKILPCLTHEMGAAYPSLGQSAAMAADVLTEEEESFLRTLEVGKKVLADLLQEKRAEVLREDVLSGEQAFKLYDTYGMPVDVIEALLDEKDLKMDHAGFEKALEAQRTRAKDAQAFRAAVHDEEVLVNQTPPTVFLGYDTLEGRGHIMAMGKGAVLCEALVPNQAQEDPTDAQTSFWLITDRTPFYGESGGQQGDHGVIETETGKARVIDTQKKDGRVLHDVVLEKGRLEKGQVATLHVDKKRRDGLAAHHSATHMLHAALQQILGKRVAQKGSLVTPNRLRFDFSYGQKVTSEKLRAIETLVNANIRRCLPVTTRETSLKKAMAEGVTALFGETYGAHVRVVSMASDKSFESERMKYLLQENTIDDQTETPFSKELCGGTHVPNTGCLGFFKILSETSTSKGVRRIEAVAGAAAEHWLYEKESHNGHVQKLLGVGEGHVIARIKQLLDERAQHAQALKKAKKASSHLAHEATDKAEKKVGGTFMCVQTFPDSSTQDLLHAWDHIKTQHPHCVAVFLSNGITTEKNANKRTAAIVGVQGLAIKALDVFQQLLGTYQGKAGGRAELAQGVCVSPADKSKLLINLEALLHESTS